MAIKKQEFYEGAALHQLARTGVVKGIEYKAPFFVINDRILVLLKYSTRGRSPWGFTFTNDEQRLLHEQSGEWETVIGLICGSDGIAAFSYDEFSAVAALRKASVHIACYRGHGKFYEVNGPDGTVGGKVSPSKWRRILGR